MHGGAKMSIKKRDDKVQSSKIERIESAHPGEVEQIGKRVREIRESLDADTSQDTFSRRLGLSLSKLNRIENGRRAPDVDFLLRLKKEFSSCDLNWLLTGEGDGYRETAASAKTKLLALLKEDKPFRQSVLAELEMLPASEAVRDQRIVDLLKAQRSDWEEIVRRTDVTMKGASKAEIAKAEESVRRYRDGVAYLDVLLSVGRDSE